MSASERELAERPKSQTMTWRMLQWAIEHHEATGEPTFDLDAQYRRAAGAHFQGCWWVKGYWVELRSTFHGYSMRVTKDEGDLPDE